MDVQSVSNSVGLMLPRYESHWSCRRLKLLDFDQGLVVSTATEY